MKKAIFLLFFVGIPIGANILYHIKPYAVLAVGIEIGWILYAISREYP